METKQNNSFKEIWNKLKECNKVIMSLHAKPDGDSLGACSTMKYVLEKNGIEVKLVSRDGLAENLMDYEFVNEIEFRGLEEFDLSKYDAVIFLDNGSLRNFNNNWSEKEKFETLTINIDHHETNNCYGDLNYVDSKAPSCCNVLVDFFREIGIEFDKEISTRLLIGICTDTGFFSHGDSLREFRDAAFLVENGADYLKEVYERIAGNTPWKIKKLHGIVLNNIEKTEIDGKKVVYSLVSSEECEKAGIEEHEIRGGIWTMQDIKDADVVFTLTETSKRVKGSLRSKWVNISKFAEYLGGGGHKKASAFIIEGSLDEVKNRVFEAIEKIGFHSAE